MLRTGLVLAPVVAVAIAWAAMPATSSSPPGLDLPPVFLVGERGADATRASRVAVVPLKGSYSFENGSGSATQFDSIWGPKSVTLDQTLIVRRRSRLTLYTGAEVEAVVLDGALARTGQPLDTSRTAWSLGQAPSGGRARAVTLRVRYAGGEVPYYAALCVARQASSGEAASAPTCTTTTRKRG
jgi:hypothetical protein